MLGKINWFGGFNNDKNKINDFGFITSLGEEKTKSDIFIARKDIPLSVQKIIEGVEGRGVYVEFDIDSKTNRGINLTIPTHIGIVSKSNSKYGQIIYNNNCQIHFKNVNCYITETVVKFVIKEIKDKKLLPMFYGENEEILAYKKVALVLEEINDIAEINDTNKIIIEACVSSQIFSMFKKFITIYLLSLPYEIAESFILEKLKYLDEYQQEVIISKISLEVPELLMRSSKLRSYLRTISTDSSSYIGFINTHINTKEPYLRESLIKELIQILEQSSRKERDIYWDKVEYLQNNLAYKNFLWSVTPIGRKILTIAEYVSTLPETDAENIVIENLQHLNNWEKESLFKELIKKAPNVILASSQLRLLLKDICRYYDYIRLINQYLDKVSVSLYEEILNELVHILRQNNEEKSEYYWESKHYWDEVKQLQNNLAYKNFLWEVAPLERKIPIILEYVTHLSEDDAESVIVENIESCNQSEQSLLIDNLIIKTPNIILASAKLRGYLECIKNYPNSYGNFINQYLDSVNKRLYDEIVAELLQRLEVANEEKRNIYWEQVKYLQNNLAYRNFLWQVAPMKVKKAIIQGKFQKLSDIISSFNYSTYPYENYISHEWRGLYKLNRSEHLLIQAWDVNVKTSDFVAAQMISARGAEKLVIQFYQSLGDQVEDISIHQITGQSEDWRFGDIKLNSIELLDVKNGRKSVNLNVYSEFCIAKFKQFRTKDVKIVAVLSPYLQKEYMGNIKPYFSVGNPKVLGSFESSKLTEIERIFSDKIISITMSRNSSTNTYLPPWLFDYDKRFYDEQYKILIQLQKLSNQDIPGWEDIPYLNNNYIPIFIAAKRPLPKDWINNLATWQVSFINYLISLPVERITLPYLFLSILRHFLSMLSCPIEKYSPEKYLELICTDETRKRPLKLYDPLDTIKDFCDTLKILWDNRKETRIDEFKIFKFSGPGLLQGKRTKEDTLTTILAYCGGLVDKKGKCGFRPLVIGKENTCPICGCLICPQNDCNYCSKNCSGLLNRSNLRIL